MTAALLEHVRCDLCGADDAEPDRWLRDRMFETTAQCFRLVRCRQCGLVYLDPRPSPSQMDHFYPQFYAPFSRSGLAGRVKRWTISREVNDLWSLLAPPARIIDVGCATGDLLQAVRERGNPCVLGIEPSEHAAEIARRCWGIEIFNGTLEQAKLPEESFNVALLSHVIEHLPSPSATIAELRRVLKPGGAVVLWLPNTNSIAARVLREWWIGYDAPRHFYSFNEETLSRLLEQHGFAVRSVTHEWIGLEWSWALRLFLREQLAHPTTDRILTVLHPALTTALTSISSAAALVKRGGRIRVIAVKRET